MTALFSCFLGLFCPAGPLPPQDEAVVLVRGADEKSRILSQGTGFVLSQDGAVATNFHVIDGMSSIHVETSSGVNLEMEGILFLDVDTDLAVLKVKGAGLSPVTRGDSDRVKPGDKVTLVGYPKGTRAVSEGTVTAWLGKGKRRIMRLSARSHKGGSGSPVFDAQGQVIGVVTQGVPSGDGTLVALAKPMAFVGDDWKKGDSLSLTQASAAARWTSAEAWYWKGTAALQRGALDDATAAFSRAIEIDREYMEAYYNRGTAWLLRGEHAKAFPDLNKAVALDPIPDAYHNRGVSRALTDPEGARADYEKVLSLDSTHVKAWCSLGNYWLRRKDHDKALADYTRSLELDPDDPVTLYQRGTCLYEMGRWQGAILDFSRQLELEPAYADSYIFRAAARKNGGDPQGAETDYTRAIELEPRKAAHYVERGKLHLSTGCHDKAVADADKAVELDARSADAYSVRGSAFDKKNDYAGAVRDLSKAIELAPDSPRLSGWHTARGASYYLAKSYERAIDDFTKTIDLKPDDITAYTLRYAATAELFDDEGVVRDLEKLVAIDPERKSHWEEQLRAFRERLSEAPRDEQGFMDRGRKRFGVKAYRSALQDFNRTIEINPKSGRGHFNRASCHMRLGDNDAAIRDFSRCIELDEAAGASPLPQPWFLRGKVYAGKGDYERAIADYTRAIEMDPRYLEAYDSRANAYIQRGAPDKAAADYDEILKADPKRAEAWYNRGSAHYQMSEFGKASADWERAVELQPGYKETLNPYIQKAREESKK